MPPVDPVDVHDVDDGLGNLYANVRPDHSNDKHLSWLNQEVHLNATEGGHENQSNFEMTGNKNVVEVVQRNQNVDEAVAGYDGKTRIDGLDQPGNVMHSVHIACIDNIAQKT